MRASKPTVVSMSSGRRYSPNTAMIVVSLAVLLSTSTWFSGTAVRPDLIAAWSLSDVQSAWLTISVQLGFVLGTLIYSVLNIADIFNARRVFLVSALLGACFNALFGLVARDIVAAVVFRFLTGVTLAGIYPVGMKIIASWFRSGLGWRLGVMVAAITLGTASPYLIRALGSSLSWSQMVLVASASAADVDTGPRITPMTTAANRLSRPIPCPPSRRAGIYHRGRRTARGRRHRSASL